MYLWRYLLRVYQTLISTHWSKTGNATALRKNKKKNMKKKIASFFAGMLFMVIFGIVDNAGIIWGMDINPLLTPEADPMLSAMLGNTFSDILGAIAGIIISWGFMQVFKVKPAEHILIELIGVTIGCLIPVGIYLI